MRSSGAANMVRARPAREDSVEAFIMNIVNVVNESMEM